MVKGRTVSFKDRIVRKVWIRCDCGGKPKKNNKSMSKRFTSSQLVDCPFEAIAQRTRVGGIQTDWTLTIVDPAHNHNSTIACAYPLLRKIAMTDDV